VVPGQCAFTMKWSAMMEHISAHFQLRSSISKGFRFKFQTGTKSYSLKFHSTWTFIFLSLPSYKVASTTFSIWQTTRLTPTEINQMNMIDWHIISYQQLLWQPDECEFEKRIEDKVQPNRRPISLTKLMKFCRILWTCDWVIDSWHECSHFQRHSQSPSK